jgi:hypothetical protein
LPAGGEGAGAILTGLNAIMARMDAGKITLSASEQRAIEH